MLHRLDEVLRVSTGLPVMIAENPLQCVALGTGQAQPAIDGYLFAKK
jgi:rod shape-determining protein MreB